ncbi:MAG: hypothetical protein ACFE9Q_14900 [Candidatus Hodarchaeota archaeon]
MRKNYRILSVVVLYTVCILLYILFFLFHIENNLLLFTLTIGSVAVLSTSTIYTVIQSKTSSVKMLKEKKYTTKQKLIQKKSFNIVEDYIDAMPSLDEYVESNKSYKDMPIIDKYIFSILSKEELNKINLLDLSKMDKILFIREMIYYDPKERKELIENMLENRNNINDVIPYMSPRSSIKIEDQIRVYIRSLLEPGEKTKIIIIDIDESVRAVKEKIALLFDYEDQVFLLSSGGILLDETSQIKDYSIDDDDEIALIPSRKDKN